METSEPSHPSKCIVIFKLAVSNNLLLLLSLLFTAVSFRPPSGISLWTELRLVATWHIPTGAPLHPPRLVSTSFSHLLRSETFFFFLCLPDMCFLCRWESAGLLKVSLLRSKPDEVSNFRENENLMASTFFLLLLLLPPQTARNNRIFSSLLFYLKMKVSKSLPSVARWWNQLPRFTHVSIYLFHRVTVSCYAFSLYWLSTLGNKICFDSRHVMTERTHAAPRADTSICHVTSCGGGAGQHFPLSN